MESQGRIYAQRAHRAEVRQLKKAAAFERGDQGFGASAQPVEIGEQGISVGDFSGIEHHVADLVGAAGAVLERSPMLPLTRRSLSPQPPSMRLNAIKSSMWPLRR